MLDSLSEQKKRLNNIRQLKRFLLGRRQYPIIIFLVIQQ